MTKDKPKFVTTPNSHIPIGIPTVLENGEPGLRVKGRGAENFDIISLSQLLQQIILFASTEK